MIVEKINAENIGYFKMPDSRSAEDTEPEILQDYAKKFKEQDPFAYALITNENRQWFHHRLMVGEIITRLQDAGYQILYPNTNAS